MNDVTAQQNIAPFVRRPWMRSSERVTTFNLLSVKLVTRRDKAQCMSLKVIIFVGCVYVLRKSSALKSGWELPTSMKNRDKGDTISEEKGDVLVQCALIVHRKYI